MTKFYYISYISNKGELRMLETKEKEMNMTFSTIQSKSFSFAKNKDLRHIKVSEMKFVKSKFVMETACGRNLVDPVDFPNQIKKTKKHLSVKGDLSLYCLKCLVAINVLKFAGREKIPYKYQEGFEILDTYFVIKTIVVGTGNQQQTFKKDTKI